MTPTQEQKLDRLLEISVRNQEKIETLEADRDDHNEKITNLEAYKNKGMGVSAVLTIIFSALGAWIMSFFQK